MSGSILSVSILCAVDRYSMRWTGTQRFDTQRSGPSGLVLATYPIHSDYSSPNNDPRQEQQGGRSEQSPAWTRVYSHTHTNLNCLAYPLGF